MVLRVVLSALLFCGSSAFADEDDEPRPVFGSHPGYLFNVGEEKTKRDVEMVMLDKPKPPENKKKRVLVDEKLTKEFQQQYQYRFGTTAAEQAINNPTRDDEHTYYSTSVTTQVYQSYQRDFGNYMIRRLAEYHIDNWFREEPSLKQVYELKGKLGNMNVTPKKGYKLKMKYNLAGPSFDAALENPYDVDFRLQILMSGLLSPHEEIVSIGYNITPRVKIEALYRQYQQLSQLVLSRKLSKHTSISLTTSTGQLPTDASIHQSLALIGIGWSE